MTSRPTAVRDWIANHDPAEQEQIVGFAERVHVADSWIAEAVEWRRLTFAMEDDWHHWICAVTTTKRGVRLLLHKGALLDESEGLLRGDGRYLRQVAFEKAAGRPDEVTMVVRQAIEHQTDMLDGR
jgi:hypothetical protein